MIKDKNYITIQAFMVKDLKLKGFELLVYAIIYGFSQGKNGWFEGSLSYLMEWTMASKPTIINILKDLTNRGLIDRADAETRGVTLPKYRVTDSGKEFLPVVKNFNQGGKKILPPGGKEILPNNNIYSEIDNNISPYNPPRENPFAEEFEELWKKYPRKDGKKDALRHFKAARKDGVSLQEISDGLDRYLNYIEKAEVNEKYIKGGGSWFCGRHWDNEYKVPKKQLKPGEIDWENV